MKVRYIGEKRKEPLRSASCIASTSSFSRKGYFCGADSHIIRTNSTNLYNKILSPLFLLSSSWCYKIKKIHSFFRNKELASSWQIRKPEQLRTQLAKKKHTAFLPQTELFTSLCRWDSALLFRYQTTRSKIRIFFLFIVQLASTTLWITTSIIIITITRVGISTNMATLTITPVTLPSLNSLINAPGRAFFQFISQDVPLS